MSMWATFMVTLAFAGNDPVLMESPVESPLIWEVSQESLVEAAATPVEFPELEARLLGGPAATAGAQGSVSPVHTPQPVGLAPWLWIVGGLVVAGVGYALRRRITSKIALPVSGLQVVERVVLQGSNGLTVVDVSDASGDVRRLLIGTGTASPVLVADLGAVAQENVATTATEAHDAILEEAVDQADAYVVQPAAAAAPSEPYRVVAARAVLEEVIAERQGARRASKLYEAQR